MFKFRPSTTSRGEGHGKVSFHATWFDVSSENVHTRFENVETQEFQNSNSAIILYSARKIYP